MSARYRKKPVVIDAIQYTGPNIEQVVDFLGDDYLTRELYEGTVHIRTLEGEMACPVDHWVIRGVKGEHYSCDPDIFDATYEPVDES